MSESSNQPSLFSSDELGSRQVKQPKRLTLDKSQLARISRTTTVSEREALPTLVLPTRWELLRPKIESDAASLQTIIRPIPEALQIMRNIAAYLQTTNGCQVLVVRADSGSGKTTFLNTLSYYLKGTELHIQTIDLQFILENEFAGVLDNTRLSSEGINLIILEGREKPDAIPNSFIEIVLATINRFSRSKGMPMLFVIPTIDEQVARAWCDHAVKIGDLVPESRLYDGSRWYNFPGVPKHQFVDITKETVRVLNKQQNIEDFGVSIDEMNQWVGIAPTMGRFIEMVASAATSRRAASTIAVAGNRREHVWTVFCAPDHRHYDHTYLVIDGLCHDEKLRLSPSKLLSPEIDTTTAKQWREPNRWARLVTTVNFLDIRLINFSITSTVACVLAYGDDDYIESFKRKTFRDYENQIPREILALSSTDLDTPLLDRRQKIQNARLSLENSNLYFLLRDVPALQARGGQSEQVRTLVQYMHLMKEVPVSHVHLCIGLALQDLLTYHRYPGYVGVETEQVLVEGQSDPKPDITIHTETDVYALEFHFFSKQFASSEVSRYVLERVIAKYMRSLPHLASQLDQRYGKLTTTPPEK